MNLYKLSSVILCTIVIASCGGGGGGNSTPASSDATLSNLTISAGVINPDFQSGTTSYTLSVDNAVASSSVTPTISQSNATVTVNGAAVSSGSASSLIPLTVGKTVLTTVVTAEDGSTTKTYTVIILRKAGVVSRELINPTPNNLSEFGKKVVILGNGNIVVTDRYDSSRFTDNGAVHLYSPFSSTPIASLYGDAGGDQLGGGRITVLANNNYVIVSPEDTENGIVNAGSVRLMNGNTGEQIGATITGDVENDRLGSRGITALANNNYVISSRFDDENGIVNAGSVRLVNGNTGEQIGATITGDVEDDLVNSSITALANNNYVISEPSDDENGIVDVGSVRLMNGTTGAQIGSTLVGDVANDQLGSDGIFELANNNYVIASGYDDENGIVNAGSVRLMNGSTGIQIGNALAGDQSSDYIGRSSITRGYKSLTVLGNNNYVIASELDTVNGIAGAGSVRLMNGSTGVQIGATLAGDVLFDNLGIGGISELANHNYVVTSPYDDENGIVDAGSVRLMNGSSGEQIGSTLAGDVTNDYNIVRNQIKALSNNNYVIASPVDDENGIVDAGSIRLMNGTTGAQIGATLVGDVTGDMGTLGVTELPNNNYVIASPVDDENGIVDAGSVRLMNGTTGAQIGATLVGDVADDQLGSHRITALANSNYVIASGNDDENGIVDAGSVRLMNGTTGAQIGATLVGDVAEDHLGARSSSNYSASILARANNNYLIVSDFDDENGIINEGTLRLVDGSNGIQIGTTIYGESSFGIRSALVVFPVSGDYFILAQPSAKRIRIIAL
jgi:hypothetical protein